MKAIITNLNKGGLAMPPGSHFGNSANLPYKQNEFAED